jgi:hypothetical protein
VVEVIEEADIIAEVGSIFPDEDLKGDVLSAA